MPPNDRPSRRGARAAARWLLAAACIALPTVASARPPAPAAVAPASAPASAPSRAPASAAPRLVEDGHYRNSDGAIVHSPAHTDTGAAPAGASAQCRDGTFSFSAHRRGTCSHHGGVARWL